MATELSATSRHVVVDTQPLPANKTLAATTAVVNHLDGLAALVINQFLRMLGEIVGALYLADTEAKLERLWSRADKAMKTLEVPARVAEHILTSRDPDILARNLRGWLRDPG